MIAPNVAGYGRIVIKVELTPAGHPAVALVVSVSVTLPASRSSDEGTYMAFRLIGDGVNEPLPLEDQVALTAPPLILPFNET